MPARRRQGKILLSLFVSDARLDALGVVFYNAIKALYDKGKKQDAELLERFWKSLTHWVGVGR